MTQLGQELGLNRVGEQMNLGQFDGLLTVGWGSLDWD
jgi:hypothetical protein